MTDTRKVPVHQSFHLITSPTSWKDVVFKASTTQSAGWPPRMSAYSRVERTTAGDGKKRSPSGELMVSPCVCSGIWCDVCVRLICGGWRDLAVAVSDGRSAPHTHLGLDRLVLPPHEKRHVVPRLQEPASIDAAHGPSPHHQHGLRLGGPPPRWGRHHAQGPRGRWQGYPCSCGFGGCFSGYVGSIQ
jgi:hypothetical protein